MRKRTFLQGLALASSGLYGAVGECCPGSTEGTVDAKRALDLESVASKVLSGFMVNNPERLAGPEGFYRWYFNVFVLLKLALAHDPWDLGDGTGRAVSDWAYLRQMLGDHTTGKVVEQGQKSFLLSLMDPASGLILNADSVDQFWIWDQGRTFRALVDWYVSLENDPRERPRIRQYIERMISGLRKLPVYGRDPARGDYVVFTSDIYVKGQPRPSGPKWYGIWGGQIIEPLVDWYNASGDEGALKFATLVTTGIVSGLQGDGYGPGAKRGLQFGADGSFTRLFHNRVSTVVGIVELGQALYKKGDRAEGLDLIRWSRKVYDWIVDRAHNINAASSYGWFPESLGDGDRVRVASETCCTADMIQLASELANASRLEASLSGNVALWDDVERFTRNGLLKAQFCIGPDFPKLLKYAPEAGWDSMKGAIHAPIRELQSPLKLEGWVACFYPNDLCRMDGKTGTPILSTWGCCMYSGPRGFYACWRNIVAKHGGDVLVNMAMNRSSEWASVRSCLLYSGQVEVTVHQPSNLHYRLPSWVNSAAVRLAINGKPVRTAEGEHVNGYVSIPSLRKGDRVTIYELVVRRVTREKVGGNNAGDSPGSPW